MKEKPRFEISKKVVLEKFDEVKEVCDIVSYSSKTNSFVSKILEEERDCMFSIHSVYEMKNIFDTSKVIYLAQGWDYNEVDGLIESKVRNYVVDNERDLEVFEDYLSKNDCENINLFLRLKLRENTLKTEKYFVFGLSSDFIKLNISRLKSIKGVSQVGVHFHRKTQNLSEWDLRREIENLFSCEILEEIDFMIIGGGLPSVYANTNAKVFKGIFDKISGFRDYLNSKGIKMIIEPGRYIAAPAGRLISHVKNIYDNNIVVDCSVYNTDMDALIVPVKLLVEGELEKGEGSPYAIKGITPCSMDLFRYRVYLNNPKIGKEIVFLNAGAYNFSTDFCDLPKVETKIVE